LKKNHLTRQIIAEFLGVAVLVSEIIGVASNNSSGLGALAAPIALGLMIVLLADVSGAYFNPVVSLFFFARKDIKLSQFISYVLAQLAGAVAGAALGAEIWNHAQPLTVNTVTRSATVAEIISEVFATAVLVWLTAKLARDGKTALIAPAVAAWYFAASVFTSTHAVMNPAVAFGRFFTPVTGATLSVDYGLELIVAQFGGTLLALILFGFISAPGTRKSKTKKPAKITKVAKKK